MTAAEVPALLVESTDGVTIPVHDLGGRGPTLLLAHATGFHARVWQPCADHLRDFHCYAPDLRGHGDSTVPDGLGFSWHGFADDLLAVIDAMGLDHVQAAGHSKGGASLLLAEQRRPGTFRTLYLYEPVVFPPVDPVLLSGDNPLAEGALRRREVFDSFDAAYANFAAKPPFNSLHPDALRAYVDHGFRPRPDHEGGGVTLKCLPAVESEVYRMGSQHGAFDHLATVACPVTVASGAVMPFGPSAFAASIVDALPHGRLELHPDLGHFGPLEDPALIASCIRRAMQGE